MSSSHGARERLVMARHVFSRDYVNTMLFSSQAMLSIVLYWLIPFLRLFTNANKPLSTKRKNPMSYSLLTMSHSMPVWKTYGEEWLFRSHDPVQRDRKSIERFVEVPNCLKAAFLQVLEYLCSDGFSGLDHLLEIWHLTDFYLLDGLKVSRLGAVDKYACVKRVN